MAATEHQRRRGGRDLENEREREEEVEKNEKRVFSRAPRNL